MIRSTSCSCRGPGFSSQHPCGDSQSSIAPVAGELTPSFDILQAAGLHRCIYTPSGKTLMPINTSKDNFKTNTTPASPTPLEEWYLRLTCDCLVKVHIHAHVLPHLHTSTYTSVRACTHSELVSVTIIRARSVEGWRSQGYSSQWL